ncbi:MAG: pantetheine-phosphate adenylyltransferase, partial [Alphaproteobacteria bacterium]
LDIIEKALGIVDTLIIGIGTNPKKEGLFHPRSRKAFIENLVPQARVIIYEGLLTHTARDVGATLLIRGLRNTGDFSEEFAIAGAAAALEPSLSVVWLPASPHKLHISSSLVKEIAQFRGNVSSFVPPIVEESLRKAYPI